MLGSSHLSPTPGEVGILCRQCGRYCRPQDEYCPMCRTHLDNTQPLEDRPAPQPIRRRGKTFLEPGASVVLQFLPSDVQIRLPLNTPAILGRSSVTNLSRSAVANQGDMLDLSELGAYRHGVSRQHCMMWRHEINLTITDLGSANGTYLNGEPLIPGQTYIVADGDQLILGMLHLTVSFVTSS